MQTKGPPVIDCFAGAGGFSWGLRQAGFNVVAAFDPSSSVIETYSRNLGIPIIQRAAHELTGDEPFQLAGADPRNCALLVGGPPCQSFSSHRRGRDSTEGGSATLEFLRLVREIQPRMFVLGNLSVSQARQGDRRLERLVGEARSAGYEVSVGVLDAADFGVPQHRRRAYLVGSGPDVPPTFCFPPPTHFRHSWITVRQAMVDLPDPPEFPEYAASLPNHKIDQFSDRNHYLISSVPPGGGYFDLPEEWRRSFAPGSERQARNRRAYSRLDWDQPASTITTKCHNLAQGRFGHPEEPRNITMREAARLQGFPDDFEFWGSTASVAYQIGSAIPPPVAQALGYEIMRVLAPSFIEYQQPRWNRPIVVPEGRVDTNLPPDEPATNPDLLPDGPNENPVVDPPDPNVEAIQPTSEPQIPLPPATQARIDEVVEALSAYGQHSIIALSGSPASGKSFTAYAAALQYCGDARLVCQVQFHPGYGYEEFVEGMRLLPHGGCEIQKGILLRLNDRALADPGHRYCLLVDEFTRANLPVVLGELLTAIECRDRPIITANGTELMVAPNLVLLVTMNPHDRSVVEIDGALRRRLRVLDFPPDIKQLREMLRSSLAGGGQGPGEKELIDDLTTVFERCRASFPEQYPHEMPFGHAVFARVRNERELHDLWQQSLKDLLHGGRRGRHRFYDTISEAYPWKGNYVAPDHTLDLNSPHEIELPSDQ